MLRELFLTMRALFRPLSRGPLSPVVVRELRVPLLMLHCVSGQPFNEALLVIRKAISLLTCLS